METSKIRLGLFGARADNGGLGSQTYDFFQWMKPAKTLVVDIEHLTGYKNHFNRYPKADIAKGFEVDPKQIDSFLQDLDIVFTIETPYNHYLFSKAKEMGVKTVLQHNFEWLAQHADFNLPKPDLFLAPSKWHIDSMDKFGVPVKYLHVPIDRQKFPFKLHKKATRFLHIAGHRTFGDRNGTEIVLESLPHIESQIEITVRTQDDLPRPYTDHRMKIVQNDETDNKELFNGEDVLILPRRYGGLSLQLNEALSLGMVPIMVDTAPQNEFLKEESLIQPTLFDDLHIKTRIDVISCKPDDLARKIDELANRDLTDLSLYSDKLACERDWRVMKPQYDKVFGDLWHSQL